MIIPQQIMGWTMARGAQFSLTMPVASEWDLQKLFADCLRLEFGPPGRLNKQGVLWFSVDIANSASSAPGARVGRGIIDGIPDTFIFYRGRGHLVEIKKPITGLLSDAQKEVLAHAFLNGCRVAIVDNEDDLMRAIDEWEIPRRRRMMMKLPKENTDG
jgi:hypothetical protein